MNEAVLFLYHLFSNAGEYAQNRIKQIFIYIMMISLGPTKPIVFLIQQSTFTKGFKYTNFKANKNRLDIIK